MSASFDSYKVFFYVGKYGNITHAASALFLSQSTVSRCIQNLEVELGCKLFDRFQHGVILTSEGELLYNHVSKACEEIFLGEEKIKQMQSVGGGRIRIGVNDFTFYQFIMPVLKEFRRDFPADVIEISSHAYETQDSIFNALATDAIDIACTVFPVPGGSDYSITGVAEFRDVLIAGNGFSQLRDRPYSFSELRSLPFASLVSGNRYLENTFQIHGITIAPAFKVDSMMHLLSLVEEGLCLAVVPQPLYEKFAGDGLFVVNMKEPLPLRAVCVATAKNRTQNAARDEFIKRIKKFTQSRGK